MRITNEYKKSGYFWLPENPDIKIPGTLTIFDGGKIELEVVGLFDESIAALNGQDDLSRIVGDVESDGFVTLENCFYKKKNYAFGGIAKSLIYANKVISGVAYDKDELLTFNSISFSVEGLNEWVGITGISVNYSSDYKSATIEYKPQNEIVFHLKSDFKLHIFFAYTLPGFSKTTEAKITQRTYFKLSSENIRELSEFTTLIHQLTYFLCFAVDDTVTIADVTASSNELVTQTEGDKPRPVPIKLYYPSLPFSETKPKIETHKMLFQFHHILENAESIFNNWLNAYTQIRPAIGLYFSAVTGTYKYLDGRFLALAQALETYHRRTSTETLMDVDKFRNLLAQLLWLCPKKHRLWLKGRLYHGNEINLGLRIKRIIEPYRTYLGNSKQRNKLIRDIVNTRNYLTHYNESLELSSAKGIDLWLLCQKIEAIFQLHLLQQLGFTNEEIEMLLKDNYKIKQKFKEI